MSTNPHPTFQPLVFLDTNVVHYVRLYLSLARDQSLPPFGAGSGDINNDLNAACGRAGKAIHSYRSGHKYFEYLEAACNAGTAVEYSPITRLELVCNTLRGRAVLHAASEGMPSRMWSRMYEDEILHRLELNVYEEVGKEADEIDNLFGSAGVTIREISPRRMSEVWPVAKLLLGLIFLEVGDCLVYTSALLAEADELWTSDGYFKNVTTWIENPGGSPPNKQTYFRDVKDRIVALVARARSIAESDVHLPKSRS